MATGADVRDILELAGGDNDTGPISKKDIINSDKKKAKKSTETLTFKRPEGMHREVYALLYSDKKDLYSETHVRELLRQLLSGVDYLHGRHIVHLDLCSDNVLVNEINAVKIVDLGSAQPFTPGHALNIEHIKETAENKVYIVLPKAPEILQGHGVGPATDIWALGVLAFIMLSADSPFHSELHWERDRNIRKGKIHFGRCYPGLSEGAINFLRSTLNSKASARPSAAECLQNPWIRGEPGEPSQPAASMLCFSTDKLQAFLKEHEAKRDRARTKVTLPLGSN